MFKSKARKQAEFLLKVEREKERLQQQEAAKEAARQKVVEDIQKFSKACIDEYRTAYQRHPKATIASTLVVGIFLLGVGGMRSNSSEHSSKLVAEPSPASVIAQPSSPDTRVPDPVTPSVETPASQLTPVAKPTPEPTPEQVAAIAYGENCQERLQGMYGFDSPVLAARSIYYNLGYTREKIKDLALDDLTKSVAYQLGTGQSEAQVIQVITQLTQQYNSETFANIVVGAAKQGYMPKYMENAQSECKDLALSKSPSQVSTDAQTSTRWGTLHSNDGKINLRTGPGTINKATGYGVNGDRVQVLDSGQDSDGYYWHKVSFPKSGAVGWVAAQLINID